MSSAAGLQSTMQGTSGSITTKGICDCANNTFVVRLTLLQGLLRWDSEASRRLKLVINSPYSSWLVTGSGVTGAPVSA